ncbi:MAG: hypothetical protein E6J01_00800 [Chloroflexi bacterium]|nr:MAG: hypothetical protein E6J01_00800 [Chloroflexota bacterium]
MDRGPGRGPDPGQGGHPRGAGDRPQRPAADAGPGAQGDHGGQRGGPRLRQPGAVHPHLRLYLRDNPGGFVDAANDVLSEFIRSGTTTILVQRGAKEEVRTVSGQGRAFDARLVVLVNENTASASEITAGAIKDHSRGVLVGTKTFGKGSVQQDFLVRDGDLHLTIAHWLTPNRHSIEKNGIVPDDEVKLANTTDEYAIDRAPNDFSKDTQLAEGLKVLER